LYLVLLDFEIFDLEFPFMGVSSDEEIWFGMGIAMPFA